MSGGLPLSVEQVTVPWLRWALSSQAPGLRVRDAEIVGVDHGTCTRVRIRVECTGHAARPVPEYVILKGGFEPHSRSMAYLHEMEVRAYREVFGSLGLPAPAWFFAAYNGEQRQGIVIMEDLTLRGVRFFPPQRAARPAEIARWLSALAAFHARTWNSPELHAGRWCWAPEHTTEFRRRMADYFVPDVWRNLVDAPRGAAASVRFHDADWARNALDRLTAVAQRRPQALLHGDAHLGNLYLDATGAPGFFDPLTRRGPVMRDVAYLICGGLDVVDRRRAEGDLLRHYADELLRHGVPADEVDRSIADYGAWLLLGYLVFLVNETHYQPEAVNTAYVARFSAAMLDHDTARLVGAIG